MKITEIIERIKASHGEQETSSCDVIKHGDPEQECTGIVVTCCATVDVIRHALERKANLIVVHEPLFWNHEDNTDWAEGNPVFEEKKALLEQGKIVVWRDHDYIHGGPPMEYGRTLPDGIFCGIARELGWEQCVVNTELKPLVFRIPPTDGETLGRTLKETLGLNGIRIIGDKTAEISTVFLCEHLFGNERNLQKILRLEQEGAQAIIPLEIVDWDLCAYVRDCCQLGRKKVIYNIGHFNFEELGMKHLARGIPGLIGHAVPVEYINSGDSFDFII